jgi:hypothetical protein
MKRLFALLFFCSASAGAATINCPTCSQDDFEKAYYQQSRPGDTIVLPKGTAVWGNSNRNNNGVIYIITDVTVVGQGDETVITLDDSGPTYVKGVIALWAKATFKHFKIIGSSRNPVTAFHVAAYTTNSGFRISDITYEGGTSDAYFAYFTEGVISGLIDHCRITGNTPQAELIMGRGPGNAWQTNNTLGTADNVFIEDCTFNNFGYVCDANSNGRFVVRYCTINGTNKIDSHGLASNSPARSVRNVEVYGNSWTKIGAGNWTNVELRGGTGMVFGNDSKAGWMMLTEYAYNASPKPWANFGIGATITHGNPTTVTTNGPHGYKTGWPVWVQAPLGVVYGFYNITVTGPNTFTIPRETEKDEVADFATTYKTPFDYPIKDQIGVGKDPITGGSEPVYLWGNSQNGGSWARSFWKPSAEAIDFYRAQMGDPAATFVEKDVIRANRDFFASSGFDGETGVSVGTTAEMNAMRPSVVGYGFWVTDQGSWKAGSPGTSGRLYTWNGNAWGLKYTPYTYPHPLTVGAPAVPAVPTAPKGLKKL